MMCTCTLLISILVGYWQSYIATPKISCSHQQLNIATADRRNPKPISGFDRTLEAIMVFYDVKVRFLSVFV